MDQSSLAGDSTAIPGAHQESSFLPRKRKFEEHPKDSLNTRGDLLDLNGEIVSIAAYYCYLSSPRNVATSFFLENEGLKAITSLRTEYLNACLTVTKGFF